MINLFSGLAIISAICTIKVNNPVHSVLFLIFTFMNVSGLLICHSLDFFALTFIVVYVGAIAVLFLFVVMMLNLTIARKFTPVYLPISLLLFFGIFSQVSFAGNEPMIGFEQAKYVDWQVFLVPVSNIEAIGQVLYTVYAPHFILASLVLLVAMIGAIVLTMLKSHTIRRQSVYEQNNRLFSLTVQKIRHTKPESV